VPVEFAVRVQIGNRHLVGGVGTGGQRRWLRRESTRTIAHEHGDRAIRPIRDREVLVTVAEITHREAVRSLTGCKRRQRGERAVGVRLQYAHAVAVVVGDQQRLRAVIQRQRSDGIRRVSCGVRRWSDERRRCDGGDAREKAAFFKRFGSKWTARDFPASTPGSFGSAKKCEREGLSERRVAFAGFPLESSRSGCQTIAARISAR
jgi:hypothetical protein